MKTSTGSTTGNTAESPVVTKVTSSDKEVKISKSKDAISEEEMNKNKVTSSEVESISKPKDKVDEVSNSKDLDNDIKLLIVDLIDKVILLETEVDRDNKVLSSNNEVENLDKDAAGGCGFVFVQVNNGQDTPGNGIGVQQVRKELGHVAQLVGFESVNGLVLLCKGVHKGVSPARVHQAKTGGNEAVIT